MQSITYLTSDSFEESFYENYSKFKHGSRTIARLFGKSLSQVADFQNDKTYVFFSAPFNNIPTASNALKDYFISNCSKQFLDKNISIKSGRIYREYSYDDDYGNMNKEERMKAISSDIFSIDKSNINPTDVLVFVDDIKITGSHEERIKELIQREGITNEVIFVYLAVYTGSDPTIEHRLNHHSVNNLKTLNTIIRNEEFIFNTRVVKYILRADIEEFVSFITYQSDTFQETLFNLSVLNEYNKNPKYKTNFEILNNLIHL